MQSPFMKTRKLIILISLSLLSLSSESFAQSGTCAGMDIGCSGDLNWFIPFPADNAWNTDISSMPVDPNSDNIIAFVGAGSPLHPDFGAGLYAGSTIGIPYQVVDTTTQPKVPIRLVAYKTESDPGPMPVPPNALIEGYPNPDDGDRHVLVLDRNGCWLYELYRGFKGHGGWKADSTAVWDMTTNEQRPYTWTSADAAGLPILPGLVRYDEVLAGAIDHAIRFTADLTDCHHIWPARHDAGTCNPQYPPMGARFRLKASFSLTGFSAKAKVILTAMKQYGFILADNGSNWYFQGTEDSRWKNKLLDELKSIPASAFEAVDESACQVSANSGQAACP